MPVPASPPRETGPRLPHPSCSIRVHIRDFASGIGQTWYFQRSPPRGRTRTSLSGRSLVLVGSRWGEQAKGTRHGSDLAKTRRGGDHGSRAAAVRRPALGRGGHRGQGHGHPPGARVRQQLRRDEQSQELFRGRKRPRRRGQTLGYYANEKKSDCTDTFKDDATTNTDIQYVARDLAKYVYKHYTKQDKPVNIVAHSMGGLVTRVALLGSGQHWDDPNFPDKRLNVPNAVTLSTPHQGVIDTDKHGTDQWQQMDPDSSFMTRLDRSDSKLNGDWNCGGSGGCTTDWTLVGSHEDGTVSYNSGIDEGNPAHKKFGYQNADDSGEVNHGNIRELHSGCYDLHYWHSGGHPRHETKDGWAPLKTAYEAATHRDDNLPR